MVAVTLLESLRSRESASSAALHEALPRHLPVRRCTLRAWRAYQRMYLGHAGVQCRLALEIQKDR